MRIDTFNQIAQTYGVQKTSGVQRVQAVSGPKDKVSISQTGQDYQVAAAAVSEAPDVRADKVSELKSKLDAGTYSVEPGDFASKLLEAYNNKISL